MIGPQTSPGHAAGWYPDPGGPQLRWWDGLQWTEHVHPLAAPPSATAPVSGTSISVPRQPTHSLEALTPEVPEAEWPKWSWPPSMASQQIAQLSGKRLGRYAAPALDTALLPGEPVVAAVAGNIGLMPAWLFATPTMVYEVRDNGEIAWIGLDQVVGWEAVPGWTGVKLQVATTAGSMELSAVHERRMHPFVQGLTAACEQAGAHMSPPVLQEFSDAFDSVLELLERHWHAGLQQCFGDVSAAAVLARDLLSGVCWALRSNGDLTPEQCMLLSILVTLGSESQGVGRGAAVRRVIETAPRQPVLRMNLPTAACVTGAAGQEEIVFGVARALEACRRTVPLNAPTSHLRRFSELAARVRGTGASA